MIDEKKLIEEIKSMVRPLLTPDGTAWFDDAIQAHNETLVDVLNAIEKQPKVGEWITVEDGLPNDLQEVSVTFVNHKPHSYYEKIKDIPMSAFAVYFRGTWYWWTSTICDYIA